MFKKGLLLALTLVVSAAATAQQPQVAVTRRPIGIMQDVNGPVESDSFVVANAGSETVSISLSRSATFFTASPSSFVLQPGATQTVTIQPAFSSGYEEGHVNINVAGFPHPVTVPIRIFIAQRPQGSTTPFLGSGLIITSGRAGQPHPASFNMSNNGSVTMQGTMLSDAPWIVPPSGLLGVGSRETVSVPFSVDPSQRPDAASPLGALIGNISMVYLRGTSSEFGAAQLGRATASVIDISKVSVVQQQPQPLAPGEVASFLAGVSDAFMTSHVFVSNRTDATVPGLQLFYSAAAANPASSLLAPLGSFPASGSAWFPYAPSSIFDVSNQTGTIQLRSPQPQLASLAGLFSVVTGQFTYLTAFPVLSSENAADNGDAVIFPGVETSSAASTDLHIQETAGHPGTFTVDFFDEQGAAVQPSRSEVIQPFGYAQLVNVVPAGARSARVSNTSSGAARLSGYAVVTDLSTRDRWTITDSRRNGAASPELFVPVPLLENATAGTFDVWVTNGSNADANVTIATSSLGPPRRRAVRRGSSSSLDARTTSVVETLALSPSETRKVTVTDAPLGHVRVYGPAGAISVAGRLTSVDPPRFGQFGTGVPAFPSSAAITAGGKRQFSLADDQQGVHPPTLLLLETSGQPATVRVTVHFSFPGGSTATAQASASREYVVPGGERLAISDVARSVIGDRRDTLGRLFKVVFDVEVISGSGRVLPFLQMIDAGGDVTLFAD